MTQLLENLNKEQIEAVTHSTGPLLIVAGAGTGKTTVITRKIAYLIQQGLAKPDEILALTFTEKAAGEMQERADILLPMGFTDPWISTFHSFGQRILEQHSIEIGLPGDFKLLTDTGQWILVHNNLDKFNLNHYRPLGNPKKFISSLLKHFSKCKDELITAREYLDYAQNLRLLSDQPVKAGKREKKQAIKAPAGVMPNISAQATAVMEQTEVFAEFDETETARLEEIGSAYHTYQKLLLDNNYLDFADLINYTLELFKKRPKILSYYRNKFKYILVDEFQDTNYAQYQLVKMLTGDKGNLTVVGDDDQSIYKFRGASVSNILKFQEDYHSLKQVTLIENYRSRQEILDLAYNFIQANNPDRLEIKLNLSKKLRGHNEKTGEIKVLEGKDLSEELNSVAKKIIELKNITSTENDTTRGEQPSWNDFAILIRSNSAAEELLPVLATHGIPHTFVASTGLYKKRLVSNLISYMKLLDNFHDSLSLYQVLVFANAGINPHTLSTLLETAAKKTLSLYEILESTQTLPKVPAETRQKIEKFLAALKNQAIMAQTKAANEIFIGIVSDLGLQKKLEAETLENAENRELLEQFYKKIETFVQENSDKSMHHFLHLLDLEMEAGDEGHIKFDPNLGPESLKVLTVHAAKGLEFKYVFIINMVDQRFPTRARNDGIEIPKALIKDILPEGDFHLQEERRLFYVSITRAKSHLYFSWAKDYGGKTLKKPSQFLLETSLVPSEKVSTATGKVIFSRPPQGVIVYQDIPANFSFTAIKAFKNCPLEYKYKYYLKFPSRSNHYLSFGQTIHATFEQFLKEHQKRLRSKQQDLFGGSGRTEAGSYEELEKLYHQNWVDEWYDTRQQKEEYRKKGLKMLKTFYEEFKNNPPNPKYIEASFRLKLGNYNFTGKIDRADEMPGGGIKILDYKTGEKVPKKTDKNDLDQLYIYQWAAKEYLNETVKEMAYWYLNEEQFIFEKVAENEKIEELKNNLLEAIELIVNTVKYDLFKQEHQKLNNHSCEFEHME